MKFTIGLIAMLSDWTDVAMCTPFPSKRPSLLNFRFSNDSTPYPLPGTHRLLFSDPVSLQEDLADDSESSSYHGTRSRSMIPRDSENNTRPSDKVYPDGNPRPSYVDACGYPDVSMNATLWDSKQRNETIYWVMENFQIYLEWMKESDQNRMTFQRYLSHAWLIDDDMSECTGDYCYVVSCENMVDGHDKDKTRTAFYAMRNIAHWNNYQKQLQEDTILAIANIRSRLNILVDDFTDSKKLKSYLEERERKKKLMMHILSTIILVVSALTGLIDAVVLPYAAALGVAIEGGMKVAVSAGRIAINTWSGGYSGASSLVTDKMGKIGWVLSACRIFTRIELTNRRDPAEDYRASLHRLFESMADYVSHDMTNEQTRILSGFRGMHGQSIVDIAASPLWLKKPMRDPNRARQLESRVEEVVINTLWRQQWVYIVEAETTSCLQDNRIWDKLKVCREDHDMVTYQPLFIGTEMEEKGSDGDHQLIQGPPGWQKLGKAPYADINLYNVVNSSRQHWGTRRYRATDEAYFREQLSLPGLYTLDKTPPSQWTIPIFRSPYGDALTSIMNKKGRAYPLVAGHCDWHGTITPECNQETHDFMQATGLYMSNNWKNAADAWNVKFDKSHYWSFEGEEGRKIVNYRPIKSIENWKDIGYWGHEDLEDDGTKEHDDGKMY